MLLRVRNLRRFVISAVINRKKQTTKRTIKKKLTSQRTGLASTNSMFGFV